MRLYDILYINTFMKAELCPRRGSPPRTSPPSRAALPRSDTDLSAAGAPAASACPGPDSCGAGRSVSGVFRRLGFAVRRGTGGRAALARSGLRAAAGLLLVFAALLALPLQAQASDGNLVGYAQDRRTEGRYLWSRGVLRRRLLGEHLRRLWKSERYDLHVWDAVGGIHGRLAQVRVRSHFQPAPPIHRFARNIACRPRA